MSVLTDVPNNLNFLPPNGFKLVLGRLPETVFFGQRANLPGLSLPSAMAPNPLVAIPYTGDHIDYEEFRASFIVSEDLGNWWEIYKWIRGDGFPEDSDEYANLESMPAGSNAGVYSDGSLVILDAKRNPKIGATFIQMHPVSLSSIQFGDDVDTIDYQTADVVFQYILFNLHKIV